MIALLLLTVYIGRACGQCRYQLNRCSGSTNPVTSNLKYCQDDGFVRETYHGTNDCTLPSSPPPGTGNGLTSSIELGHACCIASGSIPNLSCNNAISGSISAGQTIQFTFNNPRQQDVTFTNCDSNFDPQFSISRQDGTSITGQATNGCDGDDCTDSRYPCHNNRRETATYTGLASGTYRLTINPYSVGNNPTYVLRIMCGLQGVITADGQSVGGTIGNNPESVLYALQTQSSMTDVLFTDCDTNFDPQMNVYDSNFNLISNSVCDGDDCTDSRYDCSNSLRETFVLPQLDAQTTYFIKLNPYSSGGQYQIVINPTTSITSTPSPPPTTSPISSPTSFPTSSSTTTSPPTTPDCCTKRCRKEWNTLTQNERDLYINGFGELIASGEIQRISQSHNDLFNLRIHDTELFLPWHRAYLFDIESAIRGLGGQYACFGLPYWDWSNQNSGSTRPIATSGLGNYPNSGCVNDGSVFSAGRYNPADPTRDCLFRETFWCRFYSPAQLMDLIDSTIIYSTFRRDLESDPHSLPHICIGGNMATRYSPDDPSFFLHHNFVDYIWAIWQDCNDYDQSTTTSNSNAYSGSISEGLSLPHRAGSNIQVSDVLDLSTLGVIYEKGPFWNNANLNDQGNCGPDSNPNNINNAWFYDESRRRRRRRLRLKSKSQKYSQNIYNKLMKRGGKNRKQLVHEWAVSVCQYEQQQQLGKICQPPKYYDDCSNMPLNPETNDIDISLNQLLQKQGLTDCMKETRKKWYNWAKLNRWLAPLCAGCFDPFCDKTFLHQKCESIEKKKKKNQAKNKKNRAKNKKKQKQKTQAVINNDIDLNKPEYIKSFDNEIYNEQKPHHFNDFNKEFMPKEDDKYYIKISQPTIVIIICGALIMLMMFNIIICYFNGKNHEKSKYVKVRYIDSDTEFVASDANLVS